jgi:hypothetical protein
MRIVVVLAVAVVVVVVASQRRRFCMAGPSCALRACAAAKGHAEGDRAKVAISRPSCRAA